MDSAVSTALLISPLEKYKGHNAALSAEAMINRLTFKPTILSPAQELVTPELVANAHKLGVCVIPWTVNDPQAMQRLIGMGVDGLISDYPDRLAKVVQQAGFSLALPDTTQQLRD
jgi:Glycerophosphoryl diester phosphodiesterase